MRMTSLDALIVKETTVEISRSKFSSRKVTAKELCFYELGACCIRQKVLVETNIGENAIFDKRIVKIC
jgi:hypothetical protein